LKDKFQGGYSQENKKAQKKRAKKKGEGQKGVKHQGGHNKEEKKKDRRLSIMKGGTSKNNHIHGRRKDKSYLVHQKTSGSQKDHAIQGGKEAGFASPAYEKEQCIITNSKGGVKKT